MDGGWFIFDTSTERCFTSLWTRSETFQEREFTIVLDTAYDRASRCARCDVTLHVTGGAAPQTLHETVTEKFYTTAEVSGLLAEASFAVRECEDFNFTSNPAVGKLKTWWVAEAR